MVQNLQVDSPTLRTCLGTCACDPPQFYVVGKAYWGVGAWEAGQLIVHLEETDEGRNLLARPAVLFEYHEQDDEALRETAVAGIYLLREDGRVEQEEAAIITVYRIFSLEHFYAYVADPATRMQYGSVEQWQQWSPLLAYAGIAFGLTLEIVEGPFLTYYRRKGQTAQVSFPLWAMLLHQVLGSIRGVDERFVQAVDWEETICALQPLVKRLALHTDWPGTTVSRLGIPGPGRA